MVENAAARSFVITIRRFRRIPRGAYNYAVYARTAARSNSDHAEKKKNYVRGPWVVDTRGRSFYPFFCFKSGEEESAMKNARAHARRRRFAGHASRRLLDGGGCEAVAVAEAVAATSTACVPSRW